MLSNTIHPGFPCTSGKYIFASLFINLTLKIIAGHDTTARAISWILYSLAENPDCQLRCQEEIDSVISKTKSGQLEWLKKQLTNTYTKADCLRI